MNMDFINNNGWVKKFALILLLFAVPSAMEAQLFFRTNSGAITIIGYIGNPTVLIIPNTTNGYPVVSITNAAFQGRSTLTSATIPFNSGTNIGDHVFFGCSSLTNVIIVGASPKLQIMLLVTKHL